MVSWFRLGGRVGASCYQYFLEKSHFNQFTIIIFKKRKGKPFPFPFPSPRAHGCRCCFSTLPGRLRSRQPHCSTRLGAPQRLTNHQSQRPAPSESNTSTTWPRSRVGKAPPGPALASEAQLRSRHQIVRQKAARLGTLSPSGPRKLCSQQGRYKTCRLLFGTLG